MIRSFGFAVAVPRVAFSLARLHFRFLGWQFADVVALAGKTEDYQAGGKSDAGFAQEKSHNAPAQ